MKSKITNFLKQLNQWTEDAMKTAGMLIWFGICFSVIIWILVTIGTAVPVLGVIFIIIAFVQISKVF